MENRTRNGARNIAAGMINRVVQLALPFAARTVLIYELGSEYLGLNSLFSSILLVLNLSELGIGSALVYSMYKPISEDDKPMIRALLALYKKTFRYIAVFILLVGILLVPFLRFFIKGEIPSDVNIYILYIIYLANTCVSYFSFAHKKALLTAYQRSDLLSNINSIITICIYLAQIIVVYLTHNYYLFVLIYPITTLADNFWSDYVSRKHFADIYCGGQVGKEVITTIKKHVKGLAIQQLCSTSRNTFASIIISMNLGLTAIAVYSNYYYIFAAVHSFLYQIPNAIRATVGNSIASETVEKNYKDFNNIVFVYLWLCGWAAICMLCLYQPFMRAWVGQELMLSERTMSLFVIYFMLLSMGDPVALYKDAAGLWWEGRYRVIIEATANLVLSFSLGYYWGIDGILIAPILTVLSLGIVYGGYIVFHYYFKGIKFSKYLFDLFVFFVVLSIIGGLTYFSCLIISVENVYYEMACRFAICLIIPNVLLWAFFSNFKQYKTSKLFCVDIFRTIKRNR